jgi:hypothetical protein
VTLGAEEDRNLLRIGSPSQVICRHPPGSAEPISGFGNDQRYASPGADTFVSVTHFRDRNFTSFSISTSISRQHFASVGSDAHDKILADFIDDQEAVVVTADRESSGMA